MWNDFKAPFRGANLNWQRRYRVEVPFGPFAGGEIIRPIFGNIDGPKAKPWGRSVVFQDEQYKQIEHRLFSEAEVRQVEEALTLFDHYEVRGSVFEYQSPNGKLIRKFDGEIHAVFFGFGRIYLTESKEGLPSNLHCMDYNLQDLWMHPGQGNDDPYDCIVAENGNLVMTSTMMVAEFEPYTGAWVWGSLNK